MLMKITTRGQCLKLTQHLNHQLQKGGEKDITKPCTKSRLQDQCSTKF